MVKARPPGRPARTPAGRQPAIDGLDAALAVLPPPTGVTIAMVCTANRCRSPVAESIMRAEADRRGLPIKVFSMGFLASGWPVPEKGIAVAAEFGLDLTRHASEQVRAERLATADLILGMSREHAMGVVSGLPQAWPRVFTLKQFSRFTHGAAMPRRATSFASWLESAAADRSRQELVGHQPQDDITDPMGQSKTTWRRIIREIRFHVLRILDDCEPIIALGEGRRSPVERRLEAVPALPESAKPAHRGSRRPKLSRWAAERRRRVGQPP